MAERLDWLYFLTIFYYYFLFKISTKFFKKSSNVIIVNVTIASNQY
jgi:hypothetical protein